MKKIRAIRLKQFRTYTKDVISLGPYVTIIAGPSDTGKSNLIRAFRWVALNSPTGTSMIKRRQKNAASVSLLVGKTSVKRFRSKAKNHYFVDKKKLEGFDTNVPKPVADLLQMGELNFQTQHDYLFWFTLTPGQVAKKLNSVVNLDLIDATLKTLSRYVREGRAEIKLTQKRLDSATEEKARYAWVPKAHNALRSLEQKQRKLDDLSEETNELTGWVRAIQNRRKKRKVWCAVSSTGKQLLKDAEQIRDMSTNATLLRGWIGAAQIHKRAANRAVPPIDKLEELFDDISCVRKKESGLREIIQLVDRISQTAEMLKYQSEQNATELQSCIDVDYKGRCPLCQKPLKAGVRL